MGTPYAIIGDAWHGSSLVGGYLCAYLDELEARSALEEKALKLCCLAPQA